MAREVHLVRTVDVDEVERDLARLEGGPDWFRFEALMAELFAETQAVVHIQTGSLKASGRVDTEHRGDIWHGEISYGGSANVDLPAADPGPQRLVVDYAEYEQARGFHHDFMAPADGADPAFIMAMLSWFEGEG